MKVTIDTRQQKSLKGDQDTQVWVSAPSFGPGSLSSPKLVTLHPHILFFTVKRSLLLLNCIFEVPQDLKTAALDFY